MKRKLKIGVIYGGSSAERAVSLVTGQAIINNFDKKKYVVTPVEMTTDNRFFIKAKNAGRYLDFFGADRRRFDLVFLALHGTPGEDGTVQGLFQCAGVPHTGSDVLASAVAMNKVFSGQLYEAHGLPTPPFIHLKKAGWKKYRRAALRDARKLGFPLVVKPVDQGSAVGVSIVKNERDLITALDATFKKFSWLMVQKFIKGQEATCGVLEIKGNLKALPPTRIIPNLGSFYDYRSKYKPGGSTHVCPADFPKSVNKRIQELALKAHRALRCRGMSRTDIFYATDGKLWIIETNTIPGMTPTSLFPEAAAKAGISFPRMLDYIVGSAIK